MSPRVNRPQVTRESAAHLEAVAFVNASSHRSSVMLSFQDWPRTTGQVAVACGMSAPHASRAIHELIARGLVESATPEIRGRGRLYRLTREGDRIGEAFNWDARPLRTPMVRGTHPKAWYAALVARFGKGRADAMMHDLHLASIVEAPSRRWIPLRSQMRLLEEIERRWATGPFGWFRILPGTQSGTTPLSGVTFCGPSRSAWFWTWVHRRTSGSSITGGLKSMFLGPKPGRGTLTGLAPQLGARLGWVRGKVFFACGTCRGTSRSRPVCSKGLSSAAIF